MREKIVEVRWVARRRLWIVYEAEGLTPCYLTRSAAVSYACSRERLATVVRVYDEGGALAETLHPAGDGFTWVPAGGDSCHRQRNQQ